MRVFVTGATGFVGRAVTAHLLAEGHEPTALLLPREPDPEIEGLRVVRGDITVSASLVGLMNDHEAVIHMAGAVGYGQSWDACNSLNRDGTCNVAKEASRVEARRFVHLSSVSVYGRETKLSLSEEVPVKKIGDPYGDTKIDAEEIVQKLADAGRLDLTILRPTVIYGPDDKKFLPLLVENLRSGRAKIIGTGKNSVDLIHVADVAAFVVKLLGEPATVGRIYNLNNPNNCSWEELLESIASDLGVAAPRGRLPYNLALVMAGLLELISSFTGRPPRLTRYAVRVIGRQYRYAVDKALKAGFQPSVELREGIRRCLKQGGFL